MPLFSSATCRVIDNQIDLRWLESMYIAEPEYSEISACFGVVPKKKMLLIRSKYEGTSKC